MTLNSWCRFNKLEGGLGGQGQWKLSSFIFTFELLYPLLRRMTPTCRDRLRPSRCEFVAGFLRVPCTEHLQRTRNERIRSLSRHDGVILLSGGWGFVWGSLRGLQVFYVIPGSGVIVNMHKILSTCSLFRKRMWGTPYV